VLCRCTPDCPELFDYDKLQTRLARTPPKYEIECHRSGEREADGGRGKPGDQPGHAGAQPARCALPRSVGRRWAGFDDRKAQEEIAYVDAGIAFVRLDATSASLIERG
jgi:hypothetical protein